MTVTGTPSGLGTWGDISASLASDLDSQIFTLNDGDTMEVDFFTFTASGVSWAEAYTVEATLAFDSPIVGSSSGSGSGTFGTFRGFLSGGTLTWDPSTLPDVFVDSIGNSFSIDFESGSTIGFGDTATVHAYITNNGGGTEPVPEPATMLLFGTGLLGLVGYNRKRSQKG